jgi:hypothetical protein
MAADPPRAPRRRGAAASQPGHLKDTKVLPLLPIKESVEAMHEASKQDYPAPKGWLDRAHSELWGG